MNTRSSLRPIFLWACRPSRTNSAADTCISGAVFWADVQFGQFFHQALDLAQAFENLLGSGTVAELNLSAEIEPLHHLAQVDAVEIRIDVFAIAVRMSSRLT